jgi:hypothetical protein
MERASQVDAVWEDLTSLNDQTQIPHTFPIIQRSRRLNIYWISDDQARIGTVTNRDRLLR